MNSNIFRNFIFWFFHVKFSSMITPRNLTEFSLLNSMLWKVMVGSYNGRESHIDTLWNKTCFVFLAFSESLFAKNHSLTSFNSLLTIWKSVFIFLWESERFVSSAKIIGSKYFVTLLRSLTKIRNNKDPKIELWGTPHVIVSIFRCLSPYVINSFLFDK